jgi:hypothetical protein
VPEPLLSACASADAKRPHAFCSPCAPTHGGGDISAASSQKPSAPHQSPPPPPPQSGAACGAASGFCDGSQSSALPGEPVSAMPDSSASSQHSEPSAASSSPVKPSSGPDAVRRGRRKEPDSSKLSSGAMVRGALADAPCQPRRAGCVASPQHMLSDRRGVAQPPAAAAAGASSSASRHGRERLRIIARVFLLSRTTVGRSEGIPQQQQVPSSACLAAAT